jgi:alkylation response protein AidB-like acyl-CoA dehydrogenase
MHTNAKRANNTLGAAGGWCWSVLVGRAHARDARQGKETIAEGKSERDPEGFTLDRRTNTLQSDPLATAEVLCDACRVPENNLIF